MRVHVCSHARSHSQKSDVSPSPSKDRFSLGYDIAVPEGTPR